MIYFLGMNLTALLMVSACMTAIWRAGLKIKNSGIVDIFWSLLVALAALYFMVMAGGRGPRNFILMAMILIWALRLSFYIFYRNIKHAEEDTRYRAMKEKWGAEADRKMLLFYLQQGAGAVIFAWPAFFSAMNPKSGFGFFETAGFLTWAAAVWGETLSDLQLQQFKALAENKGKVCRQGLWAYSRHPNYFFEFLIWVGIFIFSLGSPAGWVTLVCPLSMYYLLNQVTGVPLTEKESLKSRGADYEAYQREVSSFFLWFPRDRQSSK